jgi:signal transduction histidine kinase
MKSIPYVLDLERKALQNEAIEYAIRSIDGPVGFYEQWPGEEARLYVTRESTAGWRKFCKLIEDNGFFEYCRADYTKRAATCQKASIDLCWAGVHNAACPVQDQYNVKVTLLGGVFRVPEQAVQARQRLMQFINSPKVTTELKTALLEAWEEIPELNSETETRPILRELRRAGDTYCIALHTRSQLHKDIENVQHDFIIMLQSLIPTIDVLQFDLEATFGIGKKWKARFESLLQTCEHYHTYLEARLGQLGPPEYTYMPLAELLYACINHYRARASNRGIEIQADLEKEYSEDGQMRVPHLRIAHDYLVRAFHNAIDNAVKYSFSGTAQHPRWIEIVGRLQTKNDRAGYAIDISNLGIGIEADELELVFNSGYQGRLRRAEYRPGYGVGMAFIKAYITMHEGQVSIESHPSSRTGWLTTLHIWLPIDGPQSTSDKEKSTYV